MANLTTWATALALFCLLQPLAEYLWDAKRLRRFPNQNCLSGITNLGYIIERLHGPRSKNLHEIHKVHPIVRLGPNALSFSSPGAIRAIYGHSTECVKGDMYSVPAGPYTSILDVVDKGEHSRKRRYMSHAFAARNLEGWEFKVADKARRLMQQFDHLCEAGDPASRGGPVLDFRKWSNLFTLDAISDIALSYQLGCIDRGDDLVTIPKGDGKKAMRYIECLHAGRRATSTLVWSTSWFRLLRAVLSRAPGHFRSQWKKGADFDEMVKYLTFERVRRYNEGERLDDILQFILEDRAGRARGLDQGEVEAEVSVFLDAGSDTTAIALTHAMYNLHRTPDALSRLREELDEALRGYDGVAPYGRVKNLPYLRACLDENLRVFPSVSGPLHRKTPPQGASIDGHWIPGNTVVAVPAYTAHRNPVFFPDAETYRPERWFEEGAREARESFVPFSTGGRGCVGRNITYIEQTVLIATLIHQYEFALPEGGWELEHEEAFNLWPGPLPLKIKKRN